MPNGLLFDSTKPEIGGLLSPSSGDFGMRNNGAGKKGMGFLGPLARPDGSVSTELSVGVDFGRGDMEIPLLVPTLDQSEIAQLLSMPPDAEIPRSIMDKAVQHAIKRLDSNLPVFAD